MKQNHYVDSALLEQNWAKWLKDKDDVESWNYLLTGIYKICQGVSLHFRPKDEEEYSELVHETFMLTIDKIKNGKLKYDPGRAPVFNLLTTTIMRQLFSLKNRESRRSKIYAKYQRRVLDEKMSAGAVIIPDTL